MVAKSIQKKVFETLLTNGRVMIEKNDKEVIVATDGTWAAKIPLKNVCFSLEKCTEHDKFGSLFVNDDKEKLLKVTSDMKKVEGGRILVKLVSQSNDFEVWVQKRLLDLCGDINLYGESPLSPVKVRNYATGEIESIILPVRTKP